MNANKKLIIGLIIVVAFLYIVFTLDALYIGATDSSVCNAVGTDACPHQEQIDFLVGAIPVIVCIAVIVGAVTYYFMAGKVQTKENNLKKNTEVLLKFLSSDEKKLVNALIENNGKVLQAEVTRLPGMNKVKTHRVTQKLIERGVIEKSSLGKTNVVQFTKEIKEGLL